MGLDDLQKNWDAYGKEDPMWAILTVPEKKGGKWDPEEFFKNGEEEISKRMTELKSQHISLTYGRALDFGCGVGRLTQGLCLYFDECHGVDIAPSMIEAAQKYNRYGEKCYYHVNEKNDLQLFPDNYFDFIYSVIVLQHMQPAYSRKYIEEFLRVLASDGVLIFQMPAELVQQPEEPNEQPSEPPKWLRPFLNLYRRGKTRFRLATPSEEFVPRMEMHAIPKEDVANLINEHGGVLLDFQQDTWAGPAWISYTYYVTKGK